MPDKCIAVATDFSARADRAIDRALQISEARDHKLCVLHALDMIDVEKANWAELNRKMRASVGQDEQADTLEFIYPEGSPPKAICRVCEEREAALLVIGPARYNSLGDYFLGTSVDYVLRNTTRPVLVVKNRVRGAYDTIVAGTDFSTASAYAIIEAARLFPDAKVHVVHAWHVPFAGWNKDAYVADELVDGETAEMTAFLERLGEGEPRLTDATSQLVRGNPLQAIREGLERDPNALVVLGSHGSSGWRQAAIGSVTSDLLRFVEGDMLVVNTKGAEG